MVISKRNFLKGCSAGIFAIAPLKVEVTGLFPSLTSQAVFARNENGNGNGNGGGRGNGNGNGNGGAGSNGSGNSGGNGNGGGNSNGGGSGNGRGNNQSRTSGAGNSDRAPSLPATRANEDADGSIDVQHTNGITETLRAGRYIMKDSKGRTIINRQATSADSRRLTNFLR